MRSPIWQILGLVACAAPAAAWAGNGSGLFQASGTPRGFNELAGPRDVLVDVYYDGHKIGETFARSRPGTLQFRSAGALLATLPQVIAADELRQALASELATHSELVCRATNAGNAATPGNCGALEPQSLGIIYDEDRFRVDLFVNPKYLRISETTTHGYLTKPDAPLGLTSSIGVALSGSSSGSTAYNVQNRTVIGMRNARIRVNSSLASGLGLVVDDFVGELDRKDLRYSAGLFWALGNDFIGQRRIIGAGFGTQFDTWADRESLYGTPIVLFLAQSARVELLVDGRLVSSRSYAGGNVAIDTSTLPSGSYMVLLRVHQANGTVREERRFFAKNAQAPPVGHPIYYAYAGILANTRRHQPISPSDTFYYQAGAAWRLGNRFALDVAALGTQRKVILEAGGWLIDRRARLRVAALASSAGDAGALIQLGSAGQGPVSVNFDVRRIWSRDGKPLIPSASFVDTFGVTRPSGVELANGSYTQATASIGLRLGSGYLAVVGSYRKDKSLPADYSIGPSVNWPVLTRNRFQLVLDASGQRTRTTTAAFAGMRVLFTGGGFSALGTLGHASQGDREGSSSSRSRFVGSLSAQYSHEDESRTLVELEAGADRNISDTTVHAGGAVYSRFGDFRADLLHNLEGDGGTQYGITFQSGLAISAHVLALGARELEPSAMIVSVAGDSPDAQFKVLVDDAVRGQVRTGQQLALFVPGYRSYKVRLVPTGAASVSFDTAARGVTLYPGNVQRLVWKAESYFTIFAQAIGADGLPIANRLVQTPKGVAETDPNGYFQIDMRRADPITISDDANGACKVTLPSVAAKRDFVSVGKVFCK